MMSRNDDIKNALNDIKSLMGQNENLTNMKTNILELTQLIGEDDVAHNNKIANNAAKNFQITESQLKKTLQELLKPYLKTWLDDNLPSIVKEMVAHQIKIIMEESNKK